MAVPKTSTYQIETGLMRKVDDLRFSKETLIEWGFAEEAVLLQAASVLVSNAREKLTERRKKKEPVKPGNSCVDALSAPTLPGILK